MALRDLWTLATAKPAKPAAPTAERGYSGAPSWGGNRAFGEETDSNALWQPPTRYATVRKMRSSPDATAAMDAIILALLSRDLEVTPGSDDPADVEIAEFIENDLHNMSSASLFDLRFEALDSALWNGCAPYQTVFALDGGDGRYHLRKLAFRPPTTIARWPTDEHGGPAGIVQLDTMGAEIAFDMEELLVFVHRRVGGDLAGTPLSRRMYAPWYVLQQYYKLAPAVYERNGMAIPWMKGVQGGDTENARIESMLMGLRGGALAYMRLTEDQTKDDFGLLSPSGTLIDPMPMMEYCRRAIFLSTFTQGQVLGSDGVGSLALGETHLSMLMVMLKAIGQMETDTYNRYLIPRWVSYNWAGVPESRLPRVTVPEPKVDDTAAFFDALLKGTQAGVSWDRELVTRAAHEKLGTPLPEADAATTQDGTDADATPQGQAAGERRVFGAAVVPAKPRELKSQIALDALGIAPNFGRMASAYEEAEAKILAAVAGIQRRQIANLIGRAREIVAKADPSLVLSTNVRDVDELAVKLRAVLDGLYDDGKREMGDELAQQNVKAPAPAEERTAADRALIAATAGTTAKLLADRLQRAWSAETLRQVRVGTFDKTALDTMLGGLGDKATLDAARQDTTVAVSSGRGAVAEAAADEIDHFVNSEILDGNTCAPCADADGAEVAVEDAQLYAPYHKCQGADRCRGVLVPVAKKG